MIILCDIDHTISDAWWRSPIMPTDHEKGDWDPYHDAAAKDVPIYEVVRLIKVMQEANVPVFGMTARPSKWRPLTERWLQNVAGLTFTELLMRDDDNFHPSDELKWQLFNKRFANKVFIDRFILIDDHEKVCKKFYEAGITVFQVHARKAGVVLA